MASAIDTSCTTAAVGVGGGIVSFSFSVLTGAGVVSTPPGTKEECGVLMVRADPSMREK